MVVAEETIVLSLTDVWDVLAGTVVAMEIGVSFSGVPWFLITDAESVLSWTSPWFKKGGRGIISLQNY